MCLISCTDTCFIIVLERGFAHNAADTILLATLGAPSIDQPMRKTTSQVSARTVSRRLETKGYKMREKNKGDDAGAAWRKRRVVWSEKNRKRSSKQWKKTLQGVCDFRFFVFHPKTMKTDFARKNAPNTIMSEAEKKTSKFQEQYVCSFHMLHNCDQDSCFMMRAVCPTP